MSRGKVLCSMYILVAVLALFTAFNSNRTFELTTEDRFTVSYLPNAVGVSVYEPKASNTMKCNLTTVNTIIRNMISQDFFYIVKDNSEDHLLDIILSNDEEEYRILYNRRTRDYMCLSNPFLKNYVPATYIHK